MKTTARPLGQTIPPAGTETDRVTIALMVKGQFYRAALVSAATSTLMQHAASLDAGRTAEALKGDGAIAFTERSVRDFGEASQIIRQQVDTPFDPLKEPLYWGHLLRVSEEVIVLLITQQHTVAHTQPIEALIREICASYSAIISGKPASQQQTGLTSVDTEKQQRPQNHSRSQLEFWKRQLMDAPELLHLPTDYPRPAVQSAELGRVQFSAPSSLIQGLRVLAGQCDTTLFTIMLSGWAMLLGRWSGDNDLIIGLPVVASGPYTSAQTRVRCITSHLALRINLPDEETVAQLLRQMDTRMREARANQDVPFEAVVESSQAPFSQSYSPVFQVSIDFNADQENATQGGEARAPMATLSKLDIAHPMVQPDLSIFMEEEQGGLSGTVEFISALFRRETIERLTKNWQVVLEAMAAHPEQKVWRLPVLTRQEQRQLLHAFNATRIAYSQERLIHQLFEEQAEQTPDAIAATCEGSHMTYAELNRKANQLAWYLNEKQVRPDQLIGICLDRSFEMVIGLMGILKAGGAYLPLDPDYPSERLHYMLQDAVPRILLTQEGLEQQLRTATIDVIKIDSGWSQIAKYPECNLNTGMMGLCSGHLAYVIYTSGSTGRPKGVMIEHRAVINRLQWMQNTYPLSSLDRVLQKTPLSFDVSAGECFGTLLSGACLVLARPKAHHDIDYLSKLVDEVGVTTLHFVPSMLEIFLDRCRGSRCSRLRQVICSGEELSASTQRAFFRVLPRARLLNLYGPTEAAIEATAWECLPGDPCSRVPIGRPISNIQMYVLDRYLQPLPIAVRGEIHIGGAGVGRGYLNQPDLTAERFVADPFNGDSAARIYKTGDVGCWRSDGVLEYLGRNDHQVKIRGIRIEAGEIEALLARHPQVTEAVVIARQDARGKNQLVAYVLPSTELAVSGPSRDETVRMTLLQEWEAIYDDVYASDMHLSGPSFAGWCSSYTDLSIPEDEMRQWLSCTVDTIQALKPKRVLEIGCGVGLLLEKIAPSCETYRGIDVSAVAIASLSKWLETQSHLQHVDVRQCPADQLAESENGSVDTVILNSVVQYFPGIDYLCQVLKEAIKRVGSGGRIFIGDVRNLNLLELFSTSLEMTRAGSEVSVSQLRERVSRRVIEERELMISPELFYQVPSRFPRVTEVEVLLKRGRYQNELAAYRYDVILHIGRHRCGSNSCSYELKYEGPGSLQCLEKEISRARPLRLCLRQVKNRRLAQDIQKRNALIAAQAHERVGQLRDALTSKDPNGEDPETFFSLGERHDYTVQLSCSLNSHEGDFDVELVDRRQQLCSEEPYEDYLVPPASDVRWGHYANSPTRERRDRQLISELRNALRTHLPEYMIPSAFVIVDSFPHLSNGKLDRRSLPAPTFKAFSAPQHEVPRGSVEEALATMWRELLYVNEIGRYDSFFQLGGHSLLAMQMISRIRDLFAIDVPMGVVLGYPTLEKLSAQVETLLRAPHSIVES